MKEFYRKTSVPTDYGFVLRDFKENKYTCLDFGLIKKSAENIFSCDLVFGCLLNYNFINVNDFSLDVSYDSSKFNYVKWLLKNNRILAYSVGENKDNEVFNPFISSIQEKFKKRKIINQKFLCPEETKQTKVSIDRSSFYELKTEKGIIENPCCFEDTFILGIVNNVICYLNIQNEDNLINQEWYPIEEIKCNFGKIIHSFIFEDKLIISTKTQSLSYKISKEKDTLKLDELYSLPVCLFSLFRTFDDYKSIIIEKSSPRNIKINVLAVSKLSMQNLYYTRFFSNF